MNDVTSEKMLLAEMDANNWENMIIGIIAAGNLIDAGHKIAARSAYVLDAPTAQPTRDALKRCCFAYVEACTAQEWAKTNKAMPSTNEGVFIAVLPLISMFEDARRLSPYIIRHEASKSTIYGNAELTCELQIFNGTAAGETVVMTEINVKRRRPHYANYSYDNNHNAPTIIQAIDAADAAAREWWDRMSKEWNAI